MSRFHTSKVIALLFCISTDQSTGSTESIPFIVSVVESAVCDSETLQLVLRLMTFPVDHVKDISQHLEKHTLKSTEAIPLVFPVAAE